MGNRIFVAIVVLLWMITMTWLLVAKILPPLDKGLPPSYRGLRTGTQAYWRIHWNDQPVGWAANSVDEASHGTKEIRGRVLLTEIPLADLAPSLIASLVEKVGRIDLSAVSRVELDPLGHLSAFDSTLSVNDLPAIRMNGRLDPLDGSKLQLRVRAGDLTHREDFHLPAEARLGSELAPDGRMPGMYVGRRWTSEVFSPFRPPNDPMERIEGEVVCTEMIRYGGDTENVRRVEFRRFDSAGVARGKDIRATVWVREDGTVLRQEVYMLDAKVRFERVQGEDAEEKAERELIRWGMPLRKQPQRPMPRPTL